MACLAPGWHGETPALAILLIAQLARVQAKYGERGYRFLLQESGHIAQNASLISTALGLTAVGIGGFLDDVMNSLIGVDGKQEVALYAILIGAEKAQVFNSDNRKKNDMATIGPNLDAIVGRAVRDTDFRKRLLTDAKSIAKEYNLSADELLTLENLNKDVADEFFGKSSAAG
jgi:Nitroreductase family